MFFIERLQKIFGIENEKKMQQRLNAVKDEFDDADTRKEAIKRATDRVIQEIEQNPNIPVIEFLKKVQGEEKLPTDIVVEAIKQMPEIKSEEATVEAIQELDLPSKGIQQIIQETDVSIENALEMATQIPDKTIKKQEQQRLQEKLKDEQEQKRKEQDKIAKTKLKKIYTTCDKIVPREVIDELKEIEQNQNQDIQKIIKQILARTAAIEWKQRGTTRIESISEVISAEQLFEQDFPKLVQSEFDSIRETDLSHHKDVSYKKYSQQDLQNMLLSQIAKNVAKNYQEVGILEIPQSTNMKKLTPDQEQFFINQIQIYAKELTNTQKIKNQIKGVQNYDIKDLITMLQKIPAQQRQEYIQTFKEYIKKNKPNIEHNQHENESR